MFNIVNILLRLLQKVEQSVCIAAFAVLVSVLFADLIAREVSGSGLHWSSEAGVFANVFLVMAGFGLASADGSHLRPRFTDSLLPETWTPFLIRLGFVLTAIFCGGLCWYSSVVVVETAAFDERSIRIGLPVWLIQLALPLAFASAVIRNLCFAIYPSLAPVPSTSASPKAIAVD